MTNTEKIISLIGFAPDSNSLEGALMDCNIVGYENYQVVNLPALKLAAIALIDKLISTPDTSNPVSGMSIRYDRPSMLAIRKLLATPTLTSKHLW